MFLRWLNRNPIALKLLFHGIATLACSWLLLRYSQDNLGINPFESIMFYSGMASWVALILSLSITPARRMFSAACKRFYFQYGKRLGDWNFLIKSRRLLGLWAAFFGLCHFLAYWYLELDFNLKDLLSEIAAKPYLSVGTAALVLFFLLSITSVNFIQIKCGRYWRPLHRSVYVLMVLVVFHVVVQQKLLSFDYIYWYTISVFLLLYRLVVYVWPKLRRKGDDGLEHHR